MEYRSIVNSMPAQISVFVGLHMNLCFFLNEPVLFIVWSYAGLGNVLFSYRDFVPALEFACYNRVSFMIAERYIPLWGFHRHRVEDHRLLCSRCLFHKYILRTLRDLVESRSMKVAYLNELHSCSFLRFIIPKLRNRAL